MMTAVISPCGLYRYRLDRPLSSLTAGRGVVAFIMLNPSTADAEQDDPTIRRCLGFAWSLRAERLVVGNLFAFRATDPRKLTTYAGCADPVGPDNDRHLAEIVAEADTVIAAWGSASKVHNLVKVRAPVVRSIVEAAGKPLHVLRLTRATGAPEHPLYLPGDLRPVPWDVAAAARAN